MPLVLNLGKRWRLVVNLTPHPGRKSIRYPLDRRLDGQKMEASGQPHTPPKEKKHPVPVGWKAGLGKRWRLVFNLTPHSGRKSIRCPLDRRLDGQKMEASVQHHTPLREKKHPVPVG